MKRDLKTKTLFISLISVSIINAQTLQQKLLAAIKTKDIREVRDLIKNGAQVNVQKRQQQPIMVAAEVQTVGIKEDDQTMANIIKKLLRKKANPAVRGRFGWTPLMAAANTGSSRVLKTLLKNKEALATIDMQDIQGNTALIIATKRTEISSGIRPTDLHAGLKKSYLAVVKSLLKNGANPNIKNAKRKTALFYAEKTGDTKMIDLLRNSMAKEPTKEPIVKPAKKPMVRPIKPRQPYTGPPYTSMPVLPRRHILK